MIPDLRYALLAPILTLALVAQDKTPTSKPSGWADTLARATTTFNSGDTDKALTLARQAVAQAERELPKEANELARPLLFLSSLLLMRGESAEAEVHARRAHAIAERQWAEAQSRIATTLKYLGAIHVQNGKLDEARTVYERAIEVSEAAVGKEHPETAKHIGNLASLLLRTGKLAAAERQFERAMAIWKEHGPNHVYTVGLMCNLAELRLMQERPGEGLRLYREALAIQEKVLEPQDPRLHNTARRYAAALRKTGNEKAATELEARFAKK